MQRSLMQSWQTKVDALRQRFDLRETSVVVSDRTWRCFHPRSTDELLDEEAFNRDGRIPYWAEIWPAARVLAQALSRRTGQSEQILELGCGVGLGTLAALAAGFNVTASDYYAEALEFVALNAQANDLLIDTSQQLDLRLLDWRDWPDDLPQFAGVIGADLLYEPGLAELVALAVSRALRPGGWAWITDPQRRHASDFAARCTQAGLIVEAVEMVETLHGDASVRVDWYQLRQPTN